MAIQNSFYFFKPNEQVKGNQYGEKLAATQTNHFLKPVNFCLLSNISWLALVVSGLVC